jgi:glycosyltransferase involved in cell wall biosynthesis
VPARLARFLALRRHRDAILSLGVRAAFLQAPEDLLAVDGWGLRVCYCFPGVENPLASARYPWARPLAPAHDRLLFRALVRADAVLASADDAAIDGLVARSGGRLSRERVAALPTRYDSSVFFPRPRGEARARLGLAADGPLVVAVGRLNRVKGWDLVADAFARLAQRTPRARLLFVGDGEDRPAVEARLAALGLAARAGVTGFLPPAAVALHLAAADVVHVGSHREGWSVAMLEALACGKPIVTTDVSGARALVREGENGFVLGSREPEAHAAALARALDLPRAAEVATSIARRYDLASLARDVAVAWPVLA